MSISNQQLDVFIETTINRLSGPSATQVGTYCVDLRTFQQRITEKLVQSCMQACEARHINAERSGDNLILTVNLDRCVMNQRQAAQYNLALEHTRVVHGNDI